MKVHASEDQLAYYRTYRSKHGDVLRMIRMQAHPTEPVEVEEPWSRLKTVWVATCILAFLGALVVIGSAAGMA